jgi:hypothetical protein
MDNPTKVASMTTTAAAAAAAASPTTGGALGPPPPPRLRLQVSSPRRPCSRLDQRFKSKFGLQEAHHHCLVNTNNAGTFFRVLHPGPLRAGDRLVLVKRLHPTWPLARFGFLLYGKQPSGVPWQMWGTKMTAPELSSLELRNFQSSHMWTGERCCFYFLRKVVAKANRNLAKALLAITRRWLYLFGCSEGGFNAAMSFSWCLLFSSCFYR